MNTNDLLAERGADYKDAWLRTGVWITENIEAVHAFGEASYAVIMIYNKLMRAQSSPFKLDHYRDIRGYISLLLTTSIGQQHLDVLTEIDDLAYNRLATLTNSGRGV